MEPIPAAATKPQRSELQIAPNDRDLEARSDDRSHAIPREIDFDPGLRARVESHLAKGVCHNRNVCGPEEDASARCSSTGNMIIDLAGIIRDPPSDRVRTGLTGSAGWVNLVSRSAQECGPGLEIKAEAQRPRPPILL